jgi:hypothetical protein
LIDESPTLARNSRACVGFMTLPKNWLIVSRFIGIENTPRAVIALTRLVYAPNAE